MKTEQPGTVVRTASDAESALGLLADARGAVRLRSGGPVGMRLASTRLGPVRLDRASFRMDFDAEVPDTDALVFGYIHAGRVGFQVPGQEHWHGAGEVYLAAHADQPRTSMVRHGDHAQIIIGLGLIRDVTGPVRFTGYAPATRQDAETWRVTCAYVRGVALHGPGSLLIGNCVRLLARTALAVFPNDTSSEPTADDRRDAHPRSLRRAVTFIDENAHRDIGVNEIAEAAHVSARTIQTAFRRHLDTTPLAYLRRVRLDHAHRDLRAADPATTTVAEVAARWGFASHSRFTAQYRAVFGRPPSDDLRT